MDQNLPRLYREYGMYSNWRNFPYSIDGLKPVERRILFSAFQIAKQKFTKSARIDGHVIGNYHPHGSVYGSIVQMVRQGFLDGQGNFGTSIGVEPLGAAASRYTEVKMNQKTLDLAFKYVKFVPWITNELDQKEPMCLPAMFPLCLLGTEYTQGIGFGYKTYCPCYKISDLFSRLKWLLNLRKTEPHISPISDCEILSGNDVLDELLKTGRAKIEVKGIIEVDNRRNVAILRSWPPGKKFETILKKLDSHMNSGAVGYTDSSEKNQTEIVFKVLRERSRDSIFQNFISDLEEAVTATISFETTVIDKDNVVKVMPIDDMLVQTFNHFKIANETMLKHEITETRFKIEEYYALQKIIPALKEYVGYAYEGYKSFDEVIKLIADEAKVTQKLVKDMIEKYKIKKLLTLNLDLEGLGDILERLEETLKNSQEFVMEQYGQI
jgi:DNA gyrase subunit A